MKTFVIVTTILTMVAHVMRNGVMGLVTGLIGGILCGFLIWYMFVLPTLKFGKWLKKDHTITVDPKVKEMGADIAVLACKMVAPNMVKYAENKVAIEEGRLTPPKTKPYYNGCTYYYKDLADVFYMKNDEMVKVLRKYVIKGEYPNTVLRDDAWGVYKETRDGERTYIEYTTECIEYLKIMLAK